MQDSKFQEVEHNGKLVGVKVMVMPPTNGWRNTTGSW